MKPRLTHLFTLCALTSLCAVAEPRAERQAAENFRAAWEQRGSLLAKRINYSGEQGASPSLMRDPLLDKLKISIEVLDILKNKVVLKKDGLTSGNVLRNGARQLPLGVYMAAYNVDQESASEYFVIGPPKTVFENLKQEIAKISAITDEERINIGAQVKRGEILFFPENYDTSNDLWQEKVVYTLGSLAAMINTLENNRQLISKDIPGLHVRGYRSKVDGSTQYYRVFIPSNYDRSRAIPLLLVMPTPFTARERPFIESAFMADHQGAVLVGKLAEKHGFAVLWPGYRNALEGLPCESMHVAEAISAVENDYNIDKARTSVYGTCGGGFYAGRLVATYPRRFAAIVYDRAVFERDMDKLRGFSEPLVSWYKALNPVDSIISDSQIRIFVINDGSKPPGHGEIESSEKFVERAKKQRSNVEANIGPPALSKIALWDTIFNWLASCRNDEHSDNKTDSFKKLGYEGPVSEIFSTPFLIVRGTATDSAGATQIDATVEFLNESYKKMFYGAVPITKNDSDITEQEIKEHSLILVGNPESNAVWKKLEAQIPIAMTDSGLSIKGHEFPANAAFTAIFEHPANPNAYILTIGAYDLNNLGLTQKVDPCRAWYDCRVFEPADTQGQTHIISKFNSSDTKNARNQETEPAQK